jgi:3-oxocholest-4-en-26-oate---CoA ligase
VTFNIADLVEHAVDVVPERIAAICGERRVSYAQLEERANRLAHYLADRGVGKGSHIGVYSRNSIEAVETMVAAYKLRAVAVNVNYRYVANELRYIFEDADLVALVHERGNAAKVAQARTEKLEHVIVVDDGSDVDFAGDEYESALTQGSPARDFPPRSPDDVYILYTGGTTGNPKGVLWRHEDIWRVLGGGIDFITGARIEDEWQQANTGLQYSMIRFPVPPLIHGAAQWATFQSLFSGGTAVLVPQFDAHDVWRTIEKHRAQVILIVGDAMARPMIEALQQGSYDTSSVVAIASSAALFSPSVKEQYLAALPNVVITDSIGSSETGFSGLGIVQKGLIQSGGPRVKIDADNVVIDEANKPVGPGVVGRLARGGHIPLGYYKDPAKTAALFVEVDGKRYVVPGDYARVEEDGTVTLLGRGSMCVNTAGEKVFPEEVEGALKSHPDVFDALVIGIPDDRLGQRVAAVVQPRPGRTPSLSSLDAHVRESIAGYKVPRSLWIVDEVKRSPSGKPDYRWALAHAESHEVTEQSAVTAGTTRL